MSGTPVEFLDKDVLDAWDDGDPLEVKLQLLERAVDRLRGRDDDPRDQRRELMLLVSKLGHQRTELVARLTALHSRAERL